MKPITKKTTLLTATFLLISLLSFSQQKENEHVKINVSGESSDPSKLRSIINSLNVHDNKTFFTNCLNLFKDPAYQNQSPDLKELFSDYLLKPDVFFESSSTTLKKDAGIIFIYRNMKIDPKTKLREAVAAEAYLPEVPEVQEHKDAKGVVDIAHIPAIPAKPATGGSEATIGEGVDFDFASINNIIFHQTYNDKWDNYLLTTKHILVVFIDASNEYYDNNTGDAKSNFSQATIYIKYKTSFFKQSLKDLSSVVKEVTRRAGTGVKPLKLNFKFYLIDPKSVKEPCDVIIKHPTFDSIAFPIHEKNSASFQVGVVNNKYKLNQFSIANNNLVVKPDSAGQANWKSNVYALLELHLPRDIDNFQPIWKVAFGTNPYHNKPGFGRWAYNMTLDRIGIYGGLKIDKDPLSNLYAGFNYAISKELSINFGWSWKNEVTPQVTAVGDISSISDALKYAKRSYSKGQFSWGFSFAPSQILSMFGSKEK